MYFIKCIIFDNPSNKHFIILGHLYVILDKIVYLIILYKQINLFNNPSNT